VNSAVQSLPSPSDEPPNNLTAVNKISVDLCGCCNQPCDGDGVKGQALQCDLFECWHHAMWEKFGSKQYKSFSYLEKFIPNTFIFATTTSAF